MTVGLLFLACYLTCAAERLESGQQSQMITAWEQKYERVQTIDLEMEGTELITPEFIPGFVKRPKSLDARQLPIKIICRIDFPNRRIYTRLHGYEYQIHLEKFARIDRQQVHDELDNHFQSYTCFPDAEMKPRQSIDSAMKNRVGKEVELLPIWHSCGTLQPLDHNGTFMARPDYRGESSLGWNTTVLAESSPNKLAIVEARVPDRKECYRFKLDPQTDYLPKQFSIARNHVLNIEVNTSYALHGDHYLPNKWEVTVFSPNRKVMRCVTLALKSVEVNREIPSNKFHVEMVDE